MITLKEVFEDLHDRLLKQQAETIIKELWKLKRRQKISFDFGTKKEFELKRIK